MALEARIEQLGERHRQLDLAIHQEMRHPHVDEFHVSELKREKLRIKEEIEELRSKTLESA